MDGARRDEVAPQADSDDNEDYEDLGSEDTQEGYEDEEEEEAAMGKYKSPPPVVTKKRVSTPAGEKALIKSMSNMQLDPNTKVADDGLHGVCLEWRAPYRWHTYAYDGSKYVDYEFLLHSTERDGISFVVRPGQKVLKVEAKLYQHLFNPDRWQGRYALDDGDLGDNLFYQSALTHATWVNKEYGGNPADKMKLSFDIGLPFKVQVEPNDPYVAANESAVSIKYYQHPSNHRITIASITLQGEEMGLRAKRNAAGADVDF